jgi:hypothetical protein
MAGSEAIGYRKLITYTLPEEGGASLRASGFTLIGEAGGGRWNRPGRPASDSHPLGKKLRWELRTCPYTPADAAIPDRLR